MTDAEEPALIPIYVLVELEDVPLIDRGKRGPSPLGTLRKAIHQSGVAKRDIVVSAEVTTYNGGLDVKQDFAALSEMMRRHTEHAKASVRVLRSRMSFEQRLADAQHQENRRADQEDRSPRPIAIFHVWIEGYADTGEQGSASRKALYGFDLEDAMQRWTMDDLDAYRYLMRYEDRVSPLSSYTGWSFWGCRIFTDEDEARKSFG